MPANLFGWNVRYVVRQPDNYAAAAGDSVFCCLRCGLEYPFVKEGRLRTLHATGLLDGLHDQLMVCGEVLKQLR